MRAHASEINLNPGLIIGAGFSAGGHLISMLGTTGGSGKFEGDAGWSEYSSTLQGAFVMGAGVDQVARVEETKGRRVKNCIIFFGGELDEKREIYEQGSPITHVDEKTSPFFFYDGEFDRPGERYVKMRDKMDRYKVPHFFEMLPKLKHGAWNKVEFRPQVVKKIDGFIQKISVMNRGR
jgi:acetyl esterase/lipase